MIDIHNIQVKQERDREHDTSENSKNCWCVPTILYRDNHEDHIVVHHDNNDRNLTTGDIDQIIAAVEEYERGG